MMPSLMGGGGGLQIFQLFGCTPNQGAFQKKLIKLDSNDLN